jgi:hypothetical protein
MGTQKGSDLRIARKECSHAHHGGADRVVVLTQHAGALVGAILLGIGLDKVDDERKTLQCIRGPDASSFLTEYSPPASPRLLSGALAISLAPRLSSFCHERLFVVGRPPCYPQPPRKWRTP